MPPRGGTDNDGGYLKTYPTYPKVKRDRWGLCFMLVKSGVEKSTSRG